ncbi:MAG: hypothetical protein WKF75_14390 [Singulisphaera sp.]
MPCWSSPSTWSAAPPVGPSLSAHFLIVPLVLFSTFVPLRSRRAGRARQRPPLPPLLSQHRAVAMMAFRLVRFAADLVALTIYLADTRRPSPLSGPLGPRTSPYTGRRTGRSEPRSGRESGRSEGGPPAIAR